MQNIGAFRWHKYFGTDLNSPDDKTDIPQPGTGPQHYYLFTGLTSYSPAAYEKTWSNLSTVNSNSLFDCDDCKNCVSYIMTSCKDHNSVIPATKIPD